MTKSPGKNGFGGNLARILASGAFAVTGELGPPRNGSREDVVRKTEHLVGNVDAVNVTDNQTAVVRMSSLAACLIAQKRGLEANMQMVCRDRNRIAMQSELLGAHALGIKNVIALTGDHQKFGDHPEAKNVFDLDSVSLIGTIKKMRDEGKLLSGRDLDGDDGRPGFFIGAAFNPFADPESFRVLRAKKKIDAGADFLQSQCLFDMERFKRFMERAVDLGLAERAFFLAGITPLKSAGMANHMKNKVPGVIVPDEIVKRISGVPKEKQAETGITIACEQIEELKTLKGVAGVHLMPVEWEHMVPAIVERAKLLPRPAFAGPLADPSAPRRPGE
ncbi:MAG: methylenetetrahydrofolate reductase [Deltaproteobacteria bacterium]|jgi:methylenetetrahydrofolate reductase (NADPH)|nr:methylenetetrahydrofolate reductase [Deltaproteobacteria bacterium]